MRAARPVAAIILRSRLLLLWDCRHEIISPAFCGCPRAAQCDRPVRDRHVSSGAADDRARSPSQYQRRADEPDGLLPRRSVRGSWSMGRSPTWSAARLPLYIGLVPVHGRQHRLRAGAVDRGGSSPSAFVQGLGACAGMVIPRAVVRDLHTGPEAAKLMSLLMLVFSISPILAPLAGTGIIAIGSAGGPSSGSCSVAAVARSSSCWRLALPETRPVGGSAREQLRQRAWRAIGLLHPRLALPRRSCFIGAFGIASFFAYLANSSFVLIDHYGLTPTQYSLAFSVNADLVLRRLAAERLPRQEASAWSG